MRAGPFLVPPARTGGGSAGPPRGCGSSAPPGSPAAFGNGPDRPSEIRRLHQPATRGTIHARFFTGDPLHASLLYLRLFVCDSALVPPDPTSRDSAPTR